jgi:hypothetical protein
VADADTGESPLEAAAGAAGRDATDAFELLANETRLAVLLALWEAYDPHGGENAVPFSTILDRVDYDDPGNLRYHLEKLEGLFVRQLAERGEYELRATGLELVKTIIAGAGVEDATLDPAEIDEPCPLCGASTTVGYRDGLVVRACTECEGPTPEVDLADGFLNAVSFPPAGLADRTAEALRTASLVAARRQVRTLFDGICPDCTGRVDGWLECCPDHDAEGTCDDCGRAFPAWARFECRVCKNHSVASPKALAMFHPAVVAFYEDHDISTRVRVDDFAAAKRVFGLVDDHGIDLCSADPRRVAVTAAADGDEVRVIFDETARAVDVRR